MEYVVGFCFNKYETKVVLIKKNQPEWQKGKLNGVGGKIESEETPNEAMIREFKEETGVNTAQQDWELFALGTQYEDADSSQRAIIFFFCMFNQEAYFKAYTTEEELIYKVAEHQVRLFPSILNLRWLIPLALTKGTKLVRFNL